ncbi:hypothetical protein DXG01_010502 [Tephrocybe rancida]|nr:hypothetical protein DXG01_010502 [Tephrocybe rancida]
MIRMQLDLNNLLGRMADARDMHSAMQHRANLTNAILAPVRLLPADVLVRIFKHTLHDIPDPSTFLLGVSNVCHAWREAALGRPSLWKVGASNQLQRFHLGASGNMSCLLLLKNSNTRDLPIGIHLRSAAPFYRYMTHLSVSADFLDSFPVFSLPGGSIPRLHKFRISVPTSGFRYSRIPSVFDNGAPHLHSLVLNLPNGNVDRLCLEALIPWSQLTHLEIGRGILLSTLCNVLSQCGTLRSLLVDVEKHDIDIDGVPPMTIVSLLNLKFVVHATVSNEDADKFMRLFSKIHLPSLELLALHTKNFVDISQAVLESSLPLRSIQSLTLTGSHLSRLTDLLPTLVNLESLYIVTKPKGALEYLSILRRCCCGTSSDRLGSIQALDKISLLTVILTNDPAADQLAELARQFRELVISWLQDPTKGKRLKQLSFYAIYNKTINKDEWERCVIIMDDAKIQVLQYITPNELKLSIRARKRYTHGEAGWIVADTCTGY